MSAQGIANGPAIRKVYTSASPGDTTAWVSAATMADWIKIVGIGTTIVVDESGNSVTLTTDAAEPSIVLPGTWKAFTSTTATRVTMGNGGMMPRLAIGSVPSTPAGFLGPYLTISVANQATLSGLAQTVDGVALTTAGMRVYLAAQTTAAQNGGWVVQTGNWTRPADWASGVAIPLGTQIQIAPGGTANFAAFGGTWYVDSASGVVDTGTIVAYPKVCKGSIALTSASPSTGAVSSLWIKGTGASGASSLALTNETTAANGVKGVLTAGAGSGSLAITGPNTVTDRIDYTITNG